MAEPTVSTFLRSCGAVREAVLRLRGSVLADELGRIARGLTASPFGVFVPAGYEPSVESVASLELFPDTLEHLTQEIQCDGHHFGRYEVSGRPSYDQTDREHLLGLAELTASLLHMHSLAQRSTHAFAQVEAQLAHQAQILDQINESVLTMDKMGYITSWNKGAERLFGYSAVEAIGRNLLFLGEDDQDCVFDDAFAERGGAMMEVRRRKKSGEVFWANLSMSPLCDGEDRHIGLIAYLTDITDRKLA